MFDVKLARDDSIVIVVSSLMVLMTDPLLHAGFEASARTCLFSVHPFNCYTFGSTTQVLGTCLTNFLYTAFSKRLPSAGHVAGIKSTHLMPMTFFQLCFTCSKVKYAVKIVFLLMGSVLAKLFSDSAHYCTCIPLSSMQTNRKCIWCVQFTFCCGWHSCC